MSARARFPGDLAELRDRTDRFGRVHRERRPGTRSAEPRMDRRSSALESGWADPRRRATLRAEALRRPNPFIEADGEDASMSRWTWVVEDPRARAIVLWTNPVFDHENVSTAEFTRLADSDLWTICLRLPSALRASYRIGVWREDTIPPWREATGRRPVILAAMGASAPDERCPDVVRGSRGSISSVAAGPDAPQDPLAVIPAATAVGRVEELGLAAGERAWIYSPADVTEPTPLLVLFDGDVWRHELPPRLDAAIDAGLLPPLHVAMLDAHDADTRWERLGVPDGQVDVVIDELLPLVRDRWAVSRDGADTLVCGQSLGGIAALWTVALSRGEVGHAIAQSPSLWRFEMAEALLEADDWHSILLEAGAYEGDMLADAAALATALRADVRSDRRQVALSPYEAGHDWAVWRTNLLRALTAHRWTAAAQAADSSSGVA
ncbi:alpha/beta hydrolase [Microbacterium sp. NPDC055903]